MKAARRDDKILTRTKARMRSCQNRIDEFDEFGNLADHSEDSDDEEVEDDDSDDEWLSDDHFGVCCSPRPPSPAVFIASTMPCAAFCV